MDPYTFDLDEPDLFTAGAVGPPGQRVFYLQGRQAGAVVTLRAEKEQVVALADYLQGLLDELPPEGPVAAADLALIEPAVAEFVVGPLAVGFNTELGRVEIVAEAAPLADEDDPVDDSVEVARARFRLSRAQVAAFIERARDLVAGGRPLCPVCGRPMNPDGHVCARSNGHRPH